MCRSVGKVVFEELRGGERVQPFERNNELIPCFLEEIARGDFSRIQLAWFLSDSSRDEDRQLRDRLKVARQRASAS